MTIYGVAILAICTLLGSYLGDLLGAALGVKSNVGGVGMAMIMLISTRIWLEKRGLLSPGIKLGLVFWGALYIPIVVAMAASLNVLGAVREGPMVLIASALTVLVCFSGVAIMGRLSGKAETMDEIEAREAEEILGQ